MRNPRQLLIIVLIILFACFGYGLRVGTNIFATQLSNVLVAPFVLIEQMVVERGLVGALQRLQLENENLRATLFAETKNTGNQKNVGFFAAHVYTSYPFSDRNTVTIDAGSTQDMKPGAIALAAPKIFFGKIWKVDLSWSEIETVLSPGMELPIRIGDAGVPALLHGGGDPLITMIDRSKTVHVHDVVYTASRGMPYGLKVGEVRSVNEHAAGAFIEASIELPYKIDTLEQVFIIKQ